MCTVRMNHRGSYAPIGSRIRSKGPRRANLTEFRMQRSVSGEIHSDAIGLDRPPAPGRVAAVAEAAGAEVLGRRTGCRPLGMLNRLPPITLDEVLNAQRAKHRAQTHRAEP